MTAELLHVANNEERLTLELKRYDGVSDIQLEQVVIAATNSSELNKMIANDARSLGRLVSVVDAPDSGAFVSMAVHRAGSLTIGVSAGSLPLVASRVRDAIAARFDSRYASAAAACAELRRTTLSADGSAGWARLHPLVITADFCDDVESGAIAGRIAACRS